MYDPTVDSNAGTDPAAHPRRAAGQSELWRDVTERDPSQTVRTGSETAKRLIFAALVRVAMICPASSNPVV